MKYKLIALACAFASTAAAQLGEYLGPGIFTHGAGDIGTRSGQQVALRFYADISGVYDSTIQPISLDAKGNLAQVNGLYGVETNLGLYGVHQWKTAQLGLDYRGNFRHYSENSYYDGSDHQLVLGYTYQKSRRLYFDMQEIAGTLSRSIGSVPGVTVGIPTVVDQPTSLLFDNREYFTQSSFTGTYLLTTRTSFSAGGDGFLVRRQSAALVGLNGYTLHGSIHHRLSRISTVGANYRHEHYDFPRAFGQSDIDSYEVDYASQLGRRWKFKLQAGIFRVEVQGVREVALDPAIAAILGTNNVPQTFYKQDTFPTGIAQLSRQFKTSAFYLQYTRSVSPGNGVYLTSRTESANATYSYTGLRKVSFTISGGEDSLASVGQNLQGYRQFNGGTGLIYALTHAIHLTARYDARHQEVNLAGYRRSSYRVAMGIAFSPGSVPLSLW